MLAWGRGALTLLSYVLFTAVIFIVFQLVLLLKILIPLSRVRILCTRVLDGLASTCWVFCANMTHRMLTGTQIHVHGRRNLRVDRWCLLLSNHQSWVDILVIIRVFFRKLPPYKFFIKKELLWLPLMGACLWGLDFPVMRRYSKGFLAKHPHLKGRDLEATRKACEKFKDHPVTVMNFAEGTRFTHAKHQAQESPFTHLLKPRAGGTALVMHAMGEVLEEILDVTIIYPAGPPGLWPFFCGKTREIIIDVRRLPFNPELVGNYHVDADFQGFFQSWINNLWREKDFRIERYLHGKVSDNGG